MLLPRRAAATLYSLQPEVLVIDDIERVTEN